MQRRASIRYWIAGVVLFCLGAGFVVWGTRVVNDALATRDWPTTAGTVVVSEITEYEDQSDGETMFTADVRYES